MPTNQASSNCIDERAAQAADEPANGLEGLMVMMIHGAAHKKPQFARPHGKQSSMAKGWVSRQQK